jgi:hypothetical protein
VRLVSGLDEGTALEGRLEPERSDGDTTSIEARFPPSPLPRRPVLRIALGGACGRTLDLELEVFRDGALLHRGDWRAVRADGLVLAGLPGLDGARVTHVRVRTSGGPPSPSDVVSSVAILGSPPARARRSGD